MNTSVQRHIIWADLLRVLAIFGVICQHYCPAYYISHPITSNILVSICDWCVPVFVMLSGMFALPAEKKFNLWERMIHITVALCFWGIMYGINYYCIQTHGSYTFWSIIQPLFWKRLPWYHLWFLYLIIGLYLLTPVIRRWLSVASKKNVLYFLLLCFAFNFVTYVNQFLPAPLHHVLPSLSAFVGYYVSGYYLTKFDIAKRNRVLLYVGALFACVGMIILNRIYGVSAHTFFVNENPLTAVLSVGVFLAFKQFDFASGWRKISWVAELVFGIYLMHDLFIQYVHIPLFDRLLPINLIVNVLCNFALCAVLTWLIRKVPYVGKYIT